MLDSTPNTIDSSTPNINSNEQKLSPIPQDGQQHQEKTFATRLYRMKFLDTGCFINAIIMEKQKQTLQLDYINIYMR